MKIVQILYDNTQRRPCYMVLLDDGSVWRQVYVEKQEQFDSLPNIMHDPAYVLEWRRAEEFGPFINL